MKNTFRYVRILLFLAFAGFITTIGTGCGGDDNSGEPNNPDLNNPDLNNPEPNETHIGSTLINVSFKTGNVVDSYSCDGVEFTWNWNDDVNLTPLDIFFTASNENTSQNWFNGTSVAYGAMPLS